jgi:hypothetical protein
MIARKTMQIVSVGSLLWLAGCPQPPDDSLEPNDSPQTATILALEQPVQARAVQDNVDVFAITVEPGFPSANRSLQLELTTLSGTECPAFTLTGPDGGILYQDTNRFCSRTGATPMSVPGALLEIRLGQGFTLRAPAAQAGIYHLTIEEKGYADNVIDTVWSYELVAHLMPPR